MTIRDRLILERVVKFEYNNGKFFAVEACDGHFDLELTREEFKQLIVELQELESTTREAEISILTLENRSLAYCQGHHKWATLGVPFGHTAYYEMHRLGRQHCPYVISSTEGKEWCEGYDRAFLESVKE